MDRCISAGKGTQLPPPLQTNQKIFNLWVRSQSLPEELSNSSIDISEFCEKLNGLLSRIFSFSSVLFMSKDSVSLNLSTAFWLLLHCDVKSILKVNTFWG